VVTLCNGSRIRYGGIKPASSVAGDPYSVIKSLELSSVFVDELTDVPESVYDFLCTRGGRSRGENGRTGRLEYPPARVFATCNPHLGWVKHRWIDKQLPNHRFIPSKVWDTIEAGHLPREYGQQLLETWADNPDWIRRYLEGDWESVVDFESIFPSPQLLAATKREVPPTEPVVLGVDVAAWGDDKTVFVLRRGYKADILLVKSHQDTMATVRQAAMLYDRFHPEMINIDSIGTGQGPCDRLIEMGYPVTPMIGGAKPADGRFLNERAENYWGLRKLLMKGLIQLPDDSKLINEMGSIKYLISGNGRTIQVESKQDIKKRLGHSPDYTDALVYAFAGAGSEWETSALVGERGVV